MGLVIGVATAVAAISFVDAMSADINDKLEKYGANILIVPRTDNLSLTYGGMTLGGVSFEMQEIRQQDLARLSTIENARNIAAVGPMVLGAVNAGGHRVLLAGVDFDAAALLKPWWSIRGAEPGNGQVLLGSDAARILGAGAGDQIPLGGHFLTVSGVLAPTGSQDDQLLFTALPAAQDILGKPEALSMVEVAALCAGCPVEDMVRQISEVLPGARVMAIQQVVKGRMETLAHIRNFSFGISSVVVLVGGLVVLVTLMGSVRERRTEIGIFRAIGFRKKHVMQVIFIEAGAVSLAAGLLGYGVGAAGAAVGIRLLAGSDAAGIAPDPVLAAAAVAAAVVVGLCASAYPALMASRMDPNEALKSM